MHPSRRTARLPSLLMLFAVLAVHAGTVLAGGKLPTPTEAEQAEVVVVLKEIYGTQMNSRDPDVKRQLAQDLLAEADNPANDAASRYVLLRKAAIFAGEAGDPVTALAALSNMDALYRTQTGELRHRILSQTMRTAREVEEFAAIAHGYAELTAIAIREDNFNIARQAAQQALVTAQRTRDPAFIAPFRTLMPMVMDAQRQYQAVASSFKTLESNPVDPDANLAVGRYLAFLKGDWEEGLPHLAKGADRDIAGAAQTELGAPEEPESRLALGDAWYATAAEESNAAMKNALLLRAALHYREALPTLQGLARRRIEVRIGEADAVAETGAGIDVPELSVRRAGGRQPAEIRKLEEGLGYKLDRRPNDAVEFQGGWYKLIERPMRWDEAQAHCRELGGFLMIVDSQERQDFAVKLAGGRHTWIGLRRVPQGGDFFWVDGTEPEFTAWAPGEPSHPGSEHWAHLSWYGDEGSHAGRWNDSNNDRMQFICEWVR